MKHPVPFRPLLYLSFNDKCTVQPFIISYLSVVDKRAVQSFIMKVKLQLPDLRFDAVNLGMETRYEVLQSCRVQVEIVIIGSTKRGHPSLQPTITHNNIMGVPFKRSYSVHYRKGSTQKA